METATGKYRKCAIAAMFERCPTKRAELEIAAWQAWELATSFADASQRLPEAQAQV